MRPVLEILIRIIELPYRLGILQSFWSPDAGAPVATYTAFGGYM